ncbi:MULTISPECIES: YhcN/YlaJ family sporulation lipoprotein [Bacillaceae]|uniref:YhcN/YlaJ family sporulation lipoprotein n=1 Tax=Evansella alkalicola TaxID=745819 RepID=A0ABS6JZ59_9BACI|nr:MULTISPECIES: YhcN/YlaJ family sporulation lipoprotein [Bacillaceae]MBU9723376.1 YhcN/YlaJ family sporulation lipoprotein [Bacillus alkalicola]
MKKFSLSISITALILFPLIGCGDNMDNNDEMEGQNFGEHGFMETEDGDLNAGTNPGANLNSKNRTKTESYHGATYNTNDGKLVQQIVDQVEGIDGVREAHVVLNEDDLIIAVEATRNITEVRWEVEQYTNNLSNDKNVIVVTNEEVVGQVRALDNELRQREQHDGFDDNIDRMIDDIDRAVRESLDRNQ